MAVLLRGPPGSGKSDVALRLIDGGGILVADDRVVLEASGGAVYASPPAPIAGLIEVRGIGVLRTGHMGRARLGLVVDLIATPVPRLPEPGVCRIEGHDFPLLSLVPYEASTPAKIRLAAAATARSGSIAGALGDTC